MRHGKIEKIGITPSTEDIIIFNGTEYTPIGGIEKIKVIQENRDMSLASGTQAITGVGFKPSFIMAIASISTSTKVSVGHSDGTTGGVIAQDASTTDRWLKANGTGSSAGLVWLGEPLGTENQYGIIDSFDSDGFTILWTKTGSPTGLGSITYACYR